ncbi:MAG: hypothetical protein IJ315_10415 [Firmicutes bacterium]|nr:hypothetical protein [Bacillota bacterium]
MPTSTENEPMRILQSALPYISTSMQHPFHLILKCLELQSLLRSPSSFTLTRGDNNENAVKDPQQKRLKMLKGIRNACAPEHTHYVDTLLQTLRMQAMLQNMPALAADGGVGAGPVIPFLRPNQPSEDTDLESSLKAMLTPQQQTMFQSFSNMLKTTGGHQYE